MIGNYGKINKLKVAKINSFINIKFVKIVKFNNYSNNILEDVKKKEVLICI